MRLENIQPDPLLQMTLLLHDCGKPLCFTEGRDGQGHFYGHAEKGALLADAALRRLKILTTIQESALSGSSHCMTR